MEEVSLITQILEGLFIYLPVVATVVASATALKVLTPTKVDDKILGGIGKIINIVLKVTNVLAGNVLKNKNKDA